MSDVLYRAATDAVTNGEGRRLDLRLVTWGEVATQTQEGIKETFARGAFAGTDPSKVVLEAQRHGGSLVGVAEAIEEREDGAYATFRVAETAAGDELLTLAREGVLKDASVVFAPKSSRQLQGGVIERTSVDLRMVAVLPRGAYPSANVLAVREEVTNMEPTVDLQPVVSRLDAVEQRMGAIETIAATPVAPVTPELYRTASLSEYTTRAYTGEMSNDLIERALSDQITGQNEGLIPPAWLTDVKRIVNLGRRAINAFGGPKALPAKGMEINYPYLNSANTVIGVQGTQKTEITSARVDFAKGSASIVTYAGGSDISYQLLQRSEPSYREAYDRVMLSEWAKVTDAAFVTAVEAASGTTTYAARGILGADVSLSTSAASDDIIDATGHGFSVGDAVVFTALSGGTGLTAGRVYWVTSTSFGANTFRVASTPGGAAIGFTADITAGTVAKVTDTGAKFRAALFEASVSVEDATGQPAGVVLASTDVFLALAAMTGIVPPTPSGNPSNASGTALAATLRMEASGLEIIRVPSVSAGKIIVSNPSAAAWHEDGPKWINAEDVAKLGQNVAVYSYAAPVVYVPAGVVEVTLI